MKSHPIKIDESKIVSIKIGPTNKDVNLKGFEKQFEKTADWEKIKNGGVLMIPVIESRMANIPDPDEDGKMNYKQQEEKASPFLIEHYHVNQTDDDINQILQTTYDDERNNQVLKYPLLKYLCKLYVVFFHKITNFY